MFSGEHKKSFIPGLIGPFLEMTLVPETGKIDAMQNITHLEWPLKIKIRKTSSYSRVQFLINVLSDLSQDRRILSHIYIYITIYDIT